MSLVAQLNLEDWIELFSNTISTDECISWAASPDFSKSYGVSNKFSKIFGYEKDTLMSDLSRFKDFVVSEDVSSLNKIGIERHFEDHPNAMHYKIRSKSGEVRLLYDKVYPLVDSQDKLVSVMGCAIDVTHLANEKTGVDFDLALGERVAAIDRQHHEAIAKLMLFQAPPRSKAEALFLLLTPQERKTLYHTIRGQSAQGVGELLHLSRRTVEYYLENIKLKLDFDSKQELILHALDSGLYEMLHKSSHV